MRWWILALVALVGCPRPAAPPGPVRGEGDVLVSFLVEDVASGEHYCMVCRFAGRPTVMAVLDLADPTLEQDLRALDALGRDRPRLTMFAVVGRFEGGRLRPPAEGALAKLRARATRLGLGFPLAALPKNPPADKAAGYRPYADSYALSTSRTVLYATADNRVRATAHLGADLTALEAALPAAEAEPGP